MTASDGIDVSPDTPCDLALEVLERNGSLAELEIRSAGRPHGRLSRSRVLAFLASTPEDVFDRTPVSWLLSGGRAA